MLHHQNSAPICCCEDKERLLCPLFCRHIFLSHGYYFLLGMHIFSYTLRKRSNNYLPHGVNNCYFFSYSHHSLCHIHHCLSYALNLLLVVCVVSCKSKTGVLQSGPAWQRSFLLILFLSTLPMQNDKACQ